MARDRNRRLGYLNGVERVRLASAARRYRGPGLHHYCAVSADPEHFRFSFGKPTMTIPRPGKSAVYVARENQVDSALRPLPKSPPGPPRPVRPAPRFG
jgi:hypothetical protein